ncbi:MAG: glycosyltransferase family 39 protein [Armatimonadota bacterium]|nr:glycosyltransferase family 39 protein [bacterium]
MMDKIKWGVVLRVTAVLMLIGAIAGLFHIRCFNGLTTRDAMDLGQIAANISEGRGFSTRMIRPMNMAFASPSDVYLPELNRPPLYPYALAGMFRFKAVSAQSVIRTSLVFYFLTVLATFLLGAKLFDWKTGLLASFLFGASAPILQVATAGNEWTMACLWFTLMLICVAGHHKLVEHSPWRALVYTVLAAVLTGALYMTSHVLWIIMLPVAIYFGITGHKRVLNLSIYVVLAALLMCPWAVRNVMRTGCPLLGATAWDAMANTSTLPGDMVYRTTMNGLPRLAVYPIEHFPDIAEKLLDQSNIDIQRLAMLLGVAILPFALVSVLYRFKSHSANAVRGLCYGVVPGLLLSLAVFSVNSDAMIVLAPFASVIASAYFILLLNAKKLHPVYAKGITLCLVLLTLLPTVTTIIWPGTGDITDNANILAAGSFFDRLRATPDTLLFTDAPWTAAWHTRASCAWVPVRDEDVEALDSLGLRMQAVVLTPESEKLPANEIWYALHTTPWWRDYLSSPNKSVEQLAATIGLTSEQAKLIKKNMPRLKRSFKLSETLAGFKSRPTDPIQPDKIQFLIRSEN